MDLRLQGLLESESIGNVFTDVILLSKPGDLKISYNLDSETGVIVKSTASLKIGGVVRIYESIFREHQYVHDILFPFSASNA